MDKTNGRQTDTADLLNFGSLTQKVLEKIRHLKKGRKKLYGGRKPWKKTRKVQKILPKSCYYLPFLSLSFLLFFFMEEKKKKYGRQKTEDKSCCFFLLNILLSFFSLCSLRSPPLLPSFHPPPPPRPNLVPTSMLSVLDKKKMKKNMSRNSLCPRDTKGRHALPGGLC